MLPPTVLTRKDEERRLEKLGVTGQAAFTLLAETAYARHCSRVEMARWAAEEFALDKMSITRDDISANILAMYAAAILWADVLGLGNKSVRHPAFRHCGKGRKRATDGEAWSAAIETAARQAPIGHFAVNENGVLVYTDGSAEVGMDESYMPYEWLLSIAQEGLRRAVSPAICFYPLMITIAFRATPDNARDWAAYFNECSARMVRWMAESNGMAEPTLSTEATTYGRCPLPATVFKSNFVTNAKLAPVAEQRYEG